VPSHGGEEISDWTIEDCLCLTSDSEESDSEGVRCRYRKRGHGRKTAAPCKADVSPLARGCAVPSCRSSIVFTL